MVMKSFLTLLVILLRIWIVSGCFAEGEVSCTCKDNQSVIKCTSLELSLNKILPNRIPRHVKSLVLRKSWSEEYITLGSKHVLKFRKLEEFDVTSNLIVNIQPFTFNYFPSLRTINLSHNRIRILEHDVFFGYLPHLQTINLSNNRIFVLLDDTFSSLKSLIHLDLRQNPLVYIAKNAFSGLHNLQTLKLENSKFTFISRQMMKPLKNLIYFEVRRMNHVRKLPKQLFKYNLNLQSIVFGDLYLLSTDKIASNAFHGLAGLRHLTLSACNLTTIPNQALRELTRLRTLDLSRNPIHVVQSSDFIGLYVLETLSLRQTGLKHIAKVAFRLLTVLKRIDLSNNRLTTLRRESFSENAENIKHISLKNNCWVCDCRIAWLTKLPLDATNQIVCTDPIEHRGGVLPSFQANCQIPIIVNSSIAPLNISLGDDVELLCSTTGKPEPVVTWYRLDYTTFSSKSRKKLNILRIPNIDERDNGKYICEAVNDAGRSEKSVWVQAQDVESPKDKISSILSSQRVGIIVIIFLVCAVTIALVFLRKALWQLLCDISCSQWNCMITSTT